MTLRCSIVIALASSALLVGCTRQPVDYTPLYGSTSALPNTIPQYSFGVPAIRHARSIWDRYAQLIAALNHADRAFVLKMESALTPDTYDAKLRARVFDFAIVDPYQVLVAENLGYAVIARTGKTDRIRGVVIIARQGDIHRLADLRGRNIAFTNSTALAATLLNEYGLLESGLDVRKRAIVLYTHSPETSLLSVSLKRVDAAAVSLADWQSFQRDHTASAGLLTILWQSDDLSGAAVMASGAIPAAHVRSVQAAIVELGARADGQEALRSAGISHFEPGNSVSYDDVWDFLQRYQRALGPLPDRMVAR